MIICVKKVFLVIEFILLLIWNNILANLRVAYDVITPGSNAKPGVIAIPLQCDTSLSITLYACVISFTPGTLTLDISTDRKSLYLHAMFIDDIEQLKMDLHQTYEKRILEILK